jgi:hypothetical protein
LTSRIACFDCGKMTGIAEYVSVAVEPFNAWYAPENEAMDWFFTNYMNYDVIVYEKITITPQTAKKSPEIQASIRQNGVIIHSCRRADKACVGQQPVEVMKFAPDSLLKELGWYTPGKDHARDATRHLVRYRAASDLEFRARLLK